jgi:hypothetical protein
VNLEKRINQELCDRVHYNVGIEDLTTFQDERGKDTFNFQFVNQTGLGLTKEELKEIQKVIEECLGQDYNFHFSTLFGIEAPHF